MYRATGGGELTRVLFLCGRSVVLDAVPEPGKQNELVPLKNLTQTPPLLSLGFLFSFTSFKCVSHFIEGDPLCQLTSNMGIWEDTAHAPSCSKTISWAGTFSRQDMGWRTLPEPKHHQEWLLEGEGTKITVRRNNIHKGRKQGERRTIISRHPIKLIFSNKTQGKGKFWY